MADNVAITAGVGTTIAADECTRNAIVEKQQIIKISYGLDGSFDGLVSPTTPLPVGGTDAVALGKAEDTAHTSGHTGVMSLGVRRDTAAALSDTAGDYTPLAVTQYGGQYCVIDSNYQNAAGPGILKLEDAAHTTGDAGVMLLGVRNDADAALSGTDLDYTAIATDSAGRVKIIPGSSATSLGKLEDAAHTSGDLGVMLLGVRQDTAAAGSGTAGDYTFIAVNSFGAVKDDINRTWQSSDANGLLKAEDTAHVTGDAGVAMLGVRNDAAATLSGTDLDYTPIATDSAGQVKIGAIIPGTSATSLGKAEDAAHVSGDVGVMMLGVRNDLMSAWSGANGDYTPISTDGAGRIVAHLDANSRSGGIVSYRNLDLDENGVNVNVAASRFFGHELYNTNAAVRYLKIYDKATAPTSADTPVMTLGLAPGRNETIIFYGRRFDNGVGIRVTTGIADGDTGAPGTSEVFGVFYTSN